MFEKEIVEKFRAMCEASISPDLYSSLIGDIIPSLKANRTALKHKKYHWVEFLGQDLPYRVLVGDPIQGEHIAAFLDAEDAKQFCIDKEGEESAKQKRL